MGEFGVFLVLLLPHNASSWCREVATAICTHGEQEGKKHMQSPVLIAAAPRCPPHHAPPYTCSQLLGAGGPRPACSLRVRSAVGAVLPRGSVTAVAASVCVR